MTRGRYFATVMPILAILYVIAIVIADGRGKVAVIGALVIAAAAVIGSTVIHPPDGTGRQRNRNRDRNRT